MGMKKKSTKVERPLFNRLKGIFEAIDNKNVDLPCSIYIVKSHFQRLVGMKLDYLTGCPIVWTAVQQSEASGLLYLFEIFKSIQTMNYIK